MDTPDLVAVETDAIARQLHLQDYQVRATVELLDEGNTVPFITRYRKDRTGGLDEEQVRLVQEAVLRRRQLNERKDRVLRSIQSQGKLTPELEQQIAAAANLKALEDLYLPFRPKKQSLATVARQRGLEPLALMILAGESTEEQIAEATAARVDAQNGLPTTAEVMQGVKHLLAELLSERVDLRTQVRKILWSGELVSKRIEGNAEAELSEADELAAAGLDKAEGGFDAEDALAGIHDRPDDEAQDESWIAEHVDDGETDGDTDEGELGATETTDSEPAHAGDASSVEVSGESTGEANESPVAGTAAADVAEPFGGVAALGISPVVEPPSAARQSAALGKGAELPDKRVSQKAAARLLAKKNLAEERRQQRREIRHRKRQKLEQSFHDYFKYSEPLKKLPHYRVLAVNRGERCKVLRVRIQVDQAQLKAAAEELVIPSTHPQRELIADALHTALTRFVVPSIEREIRRELTERAETHAVRVFAKNLRKLLLQPPLSGYRVLAVDPGFRSGCKLVALDEFGNVLGHTLIHVIGAAERVQQSRARLVEQIKQHGIRVVAIGNGTACRETEQMIASVLAEELADQDVHYLVVNEAGASVYSTSQVGREELPRHDATVRGAVSIGRRALDPLSELVKIDPASIGVGLYQHDLKAKHLRASLDAVVESCVNYVGVDLNSASPALLSYVSGLNQLTARRIYEYRQHHGPFRHREQLRDVPGIGDATYVQAAGFLKILSGENPLDATWIHPESYDTARRVMDEIQVELDQLARYAKRWAKAAPPAPANVTKPAGPTAFAPADWSEGHGPESSPVPADPQSDTASDASPPAESVSEPTEVTVASPIDPTAADATDANAVSAEATATPSHDVTSGDRGGADEATHAESRLDELLSRANVDQLCEKLHVGRWLVQDIMASLARPGRDPRADFQPPVFRREVMKLEDLKPGMELSGTVLNVVDFGAFVDIGLSDSGLVHVSRLSEKFVSDPHEVVSVGDVLHVWVVDVDEKRRRVSLTAIEPGKERAGGPRPARTGGGERNREGQPSSGHGPRGGGRGRAPQREPAAGGGRREGARAGQGGGRPGGPAGGGRANAPGGPPRGGQKAKFQKPKPPKPVVPITDAMAQGREPMRTFSDLQQFFQRKRDEDQNKK